VEHMESKKVCWIGWDKVCFPKKRGGIGIQNLEAFSIALKSSRDGGYLWIQIAFGMILYNTGMSI